MYLTVLPTFECMNNMKYETHSLFFPDLIELKHSLLSADKKKKKKMSGFSVL